MFKPCTVTTTEAANILGISLRTFFRLRRPGNTLADLQPTARNGCKNLYKISDVNKAARRTATSNTNGNNTNNTSTGRKATASSRRPTSIAYAW